MHGQYNPINNRHNSTLCITHFNYDVVTTVCMHPEESKMFVHYCFDRQNLSFQKNDIFKVCNQIVNKTSLYLQLIKVLGGKRRGPLCPLLV